MAVTEPVSSFEFEDPSLPLLDPNTKRIHYMTAGRRSSLMGGRFRVWAPAVESLFLSIDGCDQTIAFSAKSGGDELLTDEVGARTRYRLLLPDGTLVPDPASRFQPGDVHGPSEVIDPTAYQWKDSS